MQRFSPPRLRSRREERQLSRTDLAAATGKSYQSIDAYEHGRRRPPVDVLEALADTLECSVADFFEAAVS